MGSPPAPKNAAVPRTHTMLACNLKGVHSLLEFLYQPPRGPKTLGLRSLAHSERELVSLCIKELLQNIKKRINNVVEK